MRILTSLIILLGVVVPSIMLVCMQLSSNGPMGIELPQSEEDVRFLATSQALTIEGLENKYFYTLIGLMSAMVASTISFVLLTREGKRGENEN